MGWMNKSDQKKFSEALTNNFQDCCADSIVLTMLIHFRFDISN